MQGHGASRTELGLVEMQVLVERLREEKHQLSCQNLVLEEQCRHWKKSFEEEEDLIVKLKEEVAKLVSKEERLMEKNRKQKEEFESEEKRFCEEVQMVRERYWQLDVGKRKLEVDLEAARKEMKKMEASIADMGEKDSRIASLIRENEGLQMAKRKIEEEWLSRILKLKKDLTEQIINSLTSSEAEIDLENSGQKPVAESHLGSPKEELKAGIQSRAKPVSSEDTSRKIQDDAKHSPVVTLPSNAETQKHLKVDTSRMIQDGAEHSPAVTLPSNAEAQKRLKADTSRKTQDGAKHSPAVTLPSNAETQKRVKVAQGRELGDRSIEMQGRTKCCKSSGVPNGKLWNDPNKMFLAFNGNDELCMKSACALYRKHMSLGPWKNALTQPGNRGEFKPTFNTRVIALGELLTGGDPEGKMKKKKDELERENPAILRECRDICRYHYKELFEIYEYNLDPLFVP